MSKDEKSSPSPNHGLPFDPAHLLGVHSVAAAGLPFPHLTHLPNPYSLLTPPPAFPGLFGGLGSIPHPLHAAALSHSLATASYYGLPKHPSELGPTSPPSSSPSRKGGGRSPRSPASTTTVTSSHRHTVSRSSSSPCTSSAHTVNPVSSYLPSWSLNGSVYPFSHPLPTSDSKQTLSSSSLSSSSRRSRKSSSSKSESRNSSKGSSKIPQGHQHSVLSPLLSIPSAHLPASLLETKSNRAVGSEGFSFDPHSLITPYHMSPELAYLSHSLFLHRPDLGFASPFLTLSAAAAAAPSSSSSSTSAGAAPSTSTTTTTSAGLEPSQVVLSLSASSKLSSSSSSSSSLNTTDRSEDTSKKERKQKELINTKKSDESSKPDSRKPNDSVGNSSHTVRLDEADLGKDSVDDRLLVDLSQPSHFMDDDRKKQIADQIRKRIGLQDGVAALLSKHGLKHSDWLDANSEKDARLDEQTTRSELHQTVSSKEMTTTSQKVRERSHSPRESLHGQKLAEADNLKLAEQLKIEELIGTRKPLSLGDENMSEHLEESANTTHSFGLSKPGESRLDNGMASDNMDMQSSTGSESESERSTSDGCKRAADGSNDEGSPNKKRCLRLDERELTIPLEHGWNRQTIINGMGRRGIVGEVLYFAPCGKKMKTIPDVMRYLERNPNSDLGRENFSFNTKVNVGQFFEIQGAHGTTPVPLSDTEVLERIEMSQGKRARMQMLARKKREKAAREQALARQIMEAKLKRRLELQDWIMKTTTTTRNGIQWTPTEQLDDMDFANNIALLSHTRNHMQELSRRASEMRFERRLEQQTHKDMEKKERENKVMEKRKEKEQYKMLKQQERVRIQEQLRKEREMRAQQIIEARNRRQKELEEMRLADAVQRNKEREMKRQQLILLKEQERERRRQHLLLVKALEQRKRQEERQHQRQVELEVAMELKKPVEDMELKNAKPLPEYPRLKSRLCGRPIADCMMVVEFLINFGVALNLDKSSLPTLETMEKGLLCDSEEDVEDFMSLVMHLLRIAIDDVGVPNPKEAVTKLNQKITEMEMTDSTMSEILRIFVRARGEKEMSEWLSDKPMEALNPTKKAALLAFLCNELLTSKVVTSEIDKHMDAINNLRRDKWLVEGQLRQLRVFQARKFNKIHKSTDRRNTNTSQTSLISVGDDDTMSSSKMESDDDDDKDEDEDKDEEEESGNDSDGSSSVTTSASINSNTPFEPVDENTTREESDRKIEKLRKQHAAYRQKVFRASLRLRAINIGQDRYKRTYWILPLTGGVYVEGMESGVPEDYVKELELKKENECDEKVDNVKAKIVTEEGNDSKTDDMEKKEDNFAKIVKKNEEDKTEQDHNTNKKAVDCSEISNLKQVDEIKNEMKGASKKTLYGRASMENGTADEEEHVGINGARIKPASADIDNTSVLCPDLSPDLSAVRALLQNEVIIEKSLKETVSGVSRPTNGSLRSEFLCDVEHDDDVEDCDDSCVTEVTNIETRKMSTDRFSSLPGCNATLAKGEISEVSGIKSTQCMECHRHGTVIKSEAVNRHGPGACPRHGRVPASGCVNSGDIPLLAVASTDVDSHTKPTATALQLSQEPAVHEAELKPGKYGKLEARKESHKLGKAAAYPIRDIACEVNRVDSARNPPTKLVTDLVHKPEVIDRTCFSNNKLVPDKLAHAAEVIDCVSGSSKRESSGYIRTENDSKCDGTSGGGGTTKANGEAGVEASSTCLSGAGKESSLFNKVIFFDKGGKKSDTGDKSSNDNDILRVPQIIAGGQETLMSVVNHSVSQAYQGHKQEERSGKLSSSTTADASCLLSSSLLFSAIAKLPQSTTPRQLSPLLSVTSLSADTSLSGTDLTPKSKHKQPPLDLTAPVLSSTPIPAHSKTPQPLPPFHPSAQASSILDLTPPAAHSGHKSSRLSSHPHHSGDITSLPHLPQSPYIPGISHHPYGPCSASETLSSLASIISPPPAHYHPSVAVTTSALLQTPLSPRSTIGLSKTSSSFPSVDAILKGESPFPSSELLQQAASQVLRFAENKKQSSLTTYPTALSALFLSPASSSSSSSLATTTSTVTTTTLSNVTTDDFLSIYTSPQRSSEGGTKHDAEVVDQSLWFSVLPRLPCDELSLSVLSSYHQQPSPSLSPSVSSYLTPSSSPNKNSMANHESLLTSLRLLTQPATLSPSPTFSSTAGLDFGGEFKVPQPPDSNFHSDPWDLLRAAQGEAQPIPKGKQHGWWRIYDLAMLKSIMSCTLGRGIREKNLQRAIHRYLDYAQLHCTYDSEKGETNPHTDTVVGEETEQTSKAQMKKSEAKKNKDKKDTTNCDQERKLKEMSDDVDETKHSEESAVCEAGENQVKDEESSTDIKVEAHVKLETGDPDDKGSDHKEEKCAGTEGSYVVPDLPDEWSVKCMHEIELAALEEVEALEERIFQASLQAKQGWRPHKDADLKLVDRSVGETTDHESYPLDVGISRLLELEANIERRYLKPPLIRSVPLNMTNLSGGHSDRSDGEFGCDENIPPGLLLWRQAVAGADSPAQLSLCTQLLAKSISWEKSIMRVTCQICRKDDNEAELLLCDGCDKGYHTYCFRPKMENIPDGDWYCFECVSKVSGTPHCVVCGAPGGKIVSCRLCPRYIHLDCMDPPLPRMPKRWQCLNCVMEKGSSKKCKKRKEKLPTVQRITIAKLVIKDEPQDDDDMSDTAGAAASSSGLPGDGHADEVDSKNSGGQSLSEKTSNVDDTGSQPESGKKKRKRKERETLAPPTPNKKEKMMKKERKMREKKGDDVEKLKESPTEGKKNDKATHKDLLSCGRLLTEMEKHEDGWPFLKPVNKKQFPSYKKYIKCPMDFSTARGRIKAREYKHRQEFSADMRLIFNNCETFNEDDSEVGKAGYSLRLFFERRWLEIFPDDTVL